MTYTNFQQVTGIIFPLLVQSPSVPLSHAQKFCNSKRIFKDQPGDQARVDQYSTAAKPCQCTIWCGDR